MNSILSLHCDFGLNKKYLYLRPWNLLLLLTSWLLMNFSWKSTILVALRHQIQIYLHASARQLTSFQLVLWYNICIDLMNTCTLGLLQLKTEFFFKENPCRWPNFCKSVVLYGSVKCKDSALFKFLAWLDPWNKCMFSPSRKQLYGIE